MYVLRYLVISPTPNHNKVDDAVSCSVVHCRPVVCVCKIFVIPVFAISILMPANLHCSRNTCNLCTHRHAFSVFSLVGARGIDVW